MPVITCNDEGRIVRMDINYAPTVDEKIPMTDKLVAEGKLDEALEILLALEKQTRTGADTHSTSRILVHIVKLCQQVTSIVLMVQCSCPPYQDESPSIFTDCLVQYR